MKTEILNELKDKGVSASSIIDLLNGQIEKEEELEKAYKSNASLMAENKALEITILKLQKSLACESTN